MKKAELKDRYGIIVKRTKRYFWIKWLDQPLNLSKFSYKSKIGQYVVCQLVAQKLNNNI